MNPAQLAKRQERAATEPLVIQHSEEGFLVYAAGEPKNRYIVSGPPNAPQCTCPDFQYHRSDPDWQCKHILAVLKEFSDIEVVPQGTDPVEAEERRAIQEEGRAPRKRRVVSANGNGKNGASQLLLKRSVSPDGRIDSLSVEFSCPVDRLIGAEIKERAEQMLGLQAEIVQDFRTRNGKPNGTPATPARPEGTPSPAEEKSPAVSPAVPARLVNVAGMDGKWGRRLFINIEVDGKTLKLFGKREQLAAAVAAAGYSGVRIEEAITLNLPCRVTTKPSPDGKYTDIDRVLPAATQQSAQRTWR